MTKPIIGIAAKAYNGKDEVAQYLEQRHGFWKVAFADPIKDMLLIPAFGEFGLTRQHFIDPDLKEAPLELLGGKSPRQLMQLLGTEWGRNLVSTELWIRLAARHVERLSQLKTVDGIVIVDVRYENEAEWVRSIGGQVWHLVRPGARRASSHSSEDGVAVFFPKKDGYLNNDGTLEQLHARIDFALKHSFDTSAS